MALSLPEACLALTVTRYCVSGCRPVRTVEFCLLLTLTTRSGPVGSAEYSSWYPWMRWGSSGPQLTRTLLELDSDTVTVDRVCTSGWGGFTGGQDMREKNISMFDLVLLKFMCLLCPLACVKSKSNCNKKCIMQNNFFCSSFDFGMRSDLDILYYREMDGSAPGCVVKEVWRELRNSRLAFGVSVTVYVVSGRRPVSLAELASPGRVILWKGPRPVPGLVPGPTGPPVFPDWMGPNWIS